jgi:hypothetical protein
VRRNPTRDVDKDAADLRCCARGGGDLIDVVGSRRSAIDPADHAVPQANARAFRHTGSMGVDVDQAPGDDLAAGIDGIGGIAPDISIDRGDLACDDRHVSDGIKPDRWIDHAPAFDNEIIGRGGVATLPSGSDDGLEESGKDPGRPQCVGTDNSVLRALSERHRGAAAAHRSFQLIQRFSCLSL